MTKEKVPSGDTNTSQSVSTGQSTDPQDTEGLPSTADEDIRKSSRLSKVKRLIPKIQRETYNPLLRDCLPLTPMKVLANQSLYRKGPLSTPKTQEETYNSLIGVSLQLWLLISQGSALKVDPDTEPLLLTTFGEIQALLEDYEEELKDESDEEMFEAGEEMDEEIQQTADEKTQPPHSPPSPKAPKKPKKKRVRKTQPEPEPSHQHSDSESSTGSLDFKVFDNNVPTTERVKHEEVAASYADLRAAVEEFAAESENNMNNYDIAINSLMESVEKINGARVEERTTLLKALNRVSETLEADSALKASMQKMTETNTTTFGNINSLTELLRNANLPEILTQMNAFHTSLNSIST
ncbi:hypothetical protein Tco_0080437 [Tanacetum coccineum]